MLAVEPAQALISIRNLKNGNYRICNKPPTNRSFDKKCILFHKNNEWIYGVYYDAQADGYSYNDDTFLVCGNVNKKNLFKGISISPGMDEDPTITSNLTVNLNSFYLYNVGKYKPPQSCTL